MNAQNLGALGCVHESRDAVDPDDVRARPVHTRQDRYEHRHDLSNDLLSGAGKELCLGFRCPAAGKAGFANQSSGPAWSVSVQTKRNQQAWNISAFLCGTVAQDALGAGGAELPSRISVAKKFWDKPDGPPAHRKVFLDGMSFVHPNPFVWSWSEIETMLTTELGYLWEGSKTAEQVMKEFDPKMNKLLQAKAPTS